MKVFVTGGTGMIGAAIVAALRARGDTAIVLSRGSGGDVRGEVETRGAWQAAVDGCDAVIHLAGEPIAGRRWNAQIKQQIHDSRVEGTARVVEAIAQAKSRPRVLVSASGTDYYPFASGPDEFDDDEITEADPPGDDFLCRVCKNWEAEAELATPLGVRVVTMRTGIVLRKLPPVKLGSGRQWFSWIHIDDVVAAYLAAIDDDRYRGPFNLVAGSARAKELPGWVPVPAFAIRAGLGELAEYILHGRNVVPAKLRALGFRFAHTSLREAIRSPAPARTSGPGGSGSAARP